MSITLSMKIKSLPFPFIDRKRRPILLRQVTEEDRERIMKMYRDFEPKESYQGLPPAEPKRLESWVNSMLDNGFNIVGLDFDHRTVCHGAIFAIDDHRSEFILAVSPQYQNSGIGVQLTRMIKKVSQELGYNNIWLCVEPYNTKAKHIYSKLGFEFSTRSTCEECEMLVDLKSDPAMLVPVKNIMTRDVFSLKHNQTAKAAIGIFLKLGISGLPVVNPENRLVGFLTESDVLESWAVDRVINEIMTRDVVFVNEKTLLTELIPLICERGVKQIPVIEGDDRRLVGIVSRKDILRHLFMQELFP